MSDNVQNAGRGQQRANARPGGSPLFAGKPEFDVVALATSAGGLQALSAILSHLPADFPAAILVVQHLGRHAPSLLAPILDRRSPLPVREATQGERLRAGTVYVAPPDRHLRISSAHRVALSQGERVHYTRPAADPLFESVAAAYSERAIAVVLTGGGQDGTAGVQAIKAAGGTVVAQHPDSCRRGSMPLSALRTGCVDFLLSLNAIAPALVTLVTVRGAPLLFGIPLPRASLPVWHLALRAAPASF